MNLNFPVYILVVFTLFLCTTSQLIAQPDGIYRIKLLTISNQSDLKIFNILKDLGVIHFESYQEDKYRVYLGNYLGKPTAEKILPQVQKRGFTGACVEKKSTEFISEFGDSLTHTIQFIALRKLDLRKIVNNPKLNDKDKKEVYIWYHNGYYRVSMGLVNEKNTDKIEDFKTKSLGLGFTAFTQKFAGIAPVSELTTGVRPKITISNPIREEQNSENSFEFSNRSNKPKPIKVTKEIDPILLPKEAKINPNAKLKPIK